MKKTILNLIICFAASFAGVSIGLAQINQQWVQRYNGPGNYFDKAYDMVIDKHGNIYVTGYCYDSGEDYCTIKYNSCGVQQWVQRYNGPSAFTSEDVATCIALDSMGNIYVSGYSENNSSNHDYDYATVKYDSMGVQKWVMRYNGPGNDNDDVTGITVDIHNNVYITGSSIGINTREDYCTIKYNSDGAEKWVRRYNSSANHWDDAKCITADQDCNVYVSGGSLEQINSYYDFLTIKYDSNGTQLWTNRYNGTGNFSDYALSIAVGTNKRVYVTGFSAGMGDDNFCTLCCDSLGNQIWVKRHIRGWDPSGLIRDILKIDNSGNIITAGSSLVIKYAPDGSELWTVPYIHNYSYGKIYDMTVDNLNNIYVTGFISADYCTIKYDTAGVKKWGISYNGTANMDDIAYAIVLDNEKNIYVTGYSRGTGQYNNPDIVTIKYSQLLGIQPISSGVPAESSLRQNYPNPFNAQTIISYTLKAAGYVTLSAYDITGEKIGTLVNQKQNQGIYESAFDGTNYSSGVYFYSLAVDGQLADTKKMILIK